jgi:hypothetical protein
MLLMMATLFLQFPLFSNSPVSVKASAEASAAVVSVSQADAAKTEAAPVADSDNTDGRVQIATAFMPARLTPEPVALVADPVPASAFVSTAAGRPAIAPVRSKIVPERRDRRMWLGLSIAAHGAATFDAWSTRRVISSGYGHEENPLLRPFAGNASMYVAVQVGPAICDLLSRKMMTSRHSWIRHTWWVPQVASAAVSISSGIHNLGVYNNINAIH